MTRHPQTHDLVQASDAGSMLLAKRQMGDRSNYLRWTIALIIVCVVPLALQTVGVNFSSQTEAPVRAVAPDAFVEIAHVALSGSFTHTLLEWTAVCAAAFVCVLCFVQYGLTRESSLPVIGVALVCAGAMDAFHTLAADRLILATADHRELIPFTWALCRLFNGCILLVGVSIFAFFRVQKFRTRRHIGTITIISVVLIGISFGTVYLCAAYDSLPRTMFPESIIKRPYDVLPLAPYMLCWVVVFPAYLRKHRTVFAYSLLLSVIPQVATQLYMAFGSDQLHDSCFNIAHALKAVSYAVPCIGLLAGFVQTYHAQQRAEASLWQHAEELRKAHQAYEHQARQVQHQRDALAEQTAALEEQSIKLELQNVEVERKNTELEAANHQIELKASELARSSTYKSEFLANMSHEIRTPMTAILGFADVLAGSVTAKEDIDSVQTIKRNGDFLLLIINDILDLSKIEAGKIQIEQISCSPCQIVAEVASLIRVRTTAKNLLLKVDYDGPIPESIQSDPTRLRQILFNLLGNAIKFTEIGSICLKVKLLGRNSDNPQLQFQVIDTGIGMDEQQLGRLFMPFTQADSSTTRKYGGTGLGLTISKRLTEMLGGEISIESTPGHGSTFTATVNTGPLDDVKLLDEPAEAVVRQTETEHEGQGRPVSLSCRILLAEDGPDNQRLIGFVLNKAGAEVDIAEDGQQALDMALARSTRSEGPDSDAKNLYDVILMDMQMPVMDGYTATGKLREAGYAGPIIALTAHAMSGDMQKCLDAGCDDYASKPIDRAKLIGLIERYVKSPTHEVADLVEESG